MSGVSAGGGSDKHALSQNLGSELEAIAALGVFRGKPQSQDLIQPPRWALQPLGSAFRVAATTGSGLRCLAFGEYFSYIPALGCRWSGEAISDDSSAWV